MNKDQLLQELSNRIATGEIKYEEVMSSLKVVNTSVPAKKSVSITQIFYAIGAIIVIIGLVLFTYQVWNDIGTFGRISITLGLGLLLTGIGSMLYKDSTQVLATVFQFLGGLLIPGGALVALSEFGDLNTMGWPRAIAFGLIFVFYILLNSVHKNILLNFFTIANGTAFAYLLTYAVTNGLFTHYVDIYAYLTILIGICYIILGYSYISTPNGKLSRLLYIAGMVGMQIAVYSQYTYRAYNSYGLTASNNRLWFVVVSLAIITAFYLYINKQAHKVGFTALTILNATALIYTIIQVISGSMFDDVYIYLNIVMGISYLLLAHSFKDGWNSRLCEILNFFGTLGILGSAFSKIFNSVEWQFVFFVFVIGGFVLSVVVKSRVVLVLSTLFLISYVSYITGKYFADSIGWPVSLVILGFIFIALGYASITINKKYIKTQV